MLIAIAVVVFVNLLLTRNLVLSGLTSLMIIVQVLNLYSIISLMVIEEMKKIVIIGSLGWGVSVTNLSMVAQSYSN